MEMKPNQGAMLLVESTRVSSWQPRGKYCELESKFVCLLMEWVTKHEIKLANTFCKNWEPTEAKTNKLDFWKQGEETAAEVKNY